MTIEELRLYAEQLEKRIKELEDRKEPIIQQEKRKEFLPTYDILKVYKLLASLPVHTVARTDIPTQGEIYITNISGTRKLNAYINGVQYSVAIT